MKTKKSIPTRKIIFWVSGFLALIWFLLRTGTNPKRLTYPCQQAVFPLASAFLISLITVISGILIYRRVIDRSILIVLVVFIALGNISSVKLNENTKSLASLPVWVVKKPLSEIYVMDTVYATRGSVADGNSSVPDVNLDDPTMDTLFSLCSANGLHLYKTTANADGIVGKNDIVIIKGNFQFKGRLVTNTDRIKGLIRLILTHPDGFTGEILVCDNTQDVGSILFDNKNNSEDENQSILDVVNTFKAKGYPVSISEWKKFRSIKVNEYSEGDNRDGYIFQQDKVSYPKFRTPRNENVSLRYGIWNAATSSYDPERLTIINFPVLKAHGMAGATEGIKNWIGVLSTAFTDSLYGSWNDMHYKYFWSDYALVARVMAVIPPDLTIVDASYTAATNNSALPPDNIIVQTNKMLVSRDPVAASWYAAKFILKPIATAPGRADPDNLSGDPNRSYGLILRKWVKFLVDSAHLAYTMDSTKISVYKTRPNLIIQPTSLDLNASATKTEIAITSDIYWTAASSETSWLSIDPASGIRNSVLKIDVTENKGTSRTGNIVIMGNGIKRIIEVKQSAAPGLKVSQNSINLSYAAPGTEVTINSNVQWSALSNDTSWLSVTPPYGSNNDTLTISATLNYGTERTANIIISGSGITRTIVVKQDAAPQLEITPSAINTGAGASTNYIYVTSNVLWTASCNENWLTIDPITGSDNRTITVFIDKNPDSLERTAVITVSATGMNSQKTTYIQAGNVTTSVTENPFKNSISPNPVSDKINLKLLHQDLPSELEIFTINGAKLMSMKITDSNTEIDVSKFETGTYIMKIVTPKRMLTGKIFKK